MINPELLNGSVLAYLGDSYYEQEIRSYLVACGITNIKDLNKEAIKYTSGKAQAEIIRSFLTENLLTEKEVSIYKKGRNVSGTRKRNLGLQATHDSNGFEALIGYLSIQDNKRVKELINLAISYVKRTNGKKSNT